MKLKTARKFLSRNACKFKMACLNRESNSFTRRYNKCTMTLMKSLNRYMWE